VGSGERAAVAERASRRDSVAARVDFFGLPLDPLSLEDAVREVERFIAERSAAEHGCLCPTTLIRSRDDARYRETLSRFRLVTADGQSIVWVSRLLGVHVPERVAGIDLMLALLPVAEAKGYRVFLLGTTPDALAEAVESIRRRYPLINIVGAHHGYFLPSEEAAVVAQIAAAKPDLLFLGMETPAKEYFVARHQPTLQVPFALGVGWTLDLLAGRKRRAPRWLQRIGFEWAFRVAQEPRRLGRRFLVGNLRFVFLVARQLPSVVRSQRDRRRQVGHG
jgi:N-acetylglucosaminyldiphosphoundecaprenol N-acetyl-beta-D-mannosaminyltransferase